MSKSSKKLTERDKDMYSVVICFLLILPYILILYAQTTKKISHTENMISREKNRIEVHGTAPELPSESTAELEAALAKIKERGDGVVSRVALREQRFAALDTVDDVKLLRLEIISLAEWTGVSLNKFGDLTDSEKTDSVGVLMEAARNQYKRPVVSLEVTSDFSRLVEFISGLSNLSKTVAVVRFEVEAPEFDTDPAAAVGIPSLTAKLDLVL
ncbi:MAG: hypothetical protein AAF557_12940 [Pseudomonadota bacterium]